jgi:hypothetical protein
MSSTVRFDSVLVLGFALALVTFLGTVCPERAAAQEELFVADSANDSITV